MASSAVASKSNPFIRLKVQVRAVTREQFRCWIDIGTGEVYRCSGFCSSGGDQLQFGWMGGNVSSRVNARQIGFHFLVDGDGVNFHLQAPALQKVEVDHKTDIDDQCIKRNCFFFAGAVVENSRAVTWSVP